MQSLALQPKSGVAAGTYPLTITATTGSLSHAITLQMKVVALTGTVSSTAVTLGPGGTATVNVSATVSGDFTGDVRLICTAPASIECSAAPADGTVSPGTPLQSVLTLHAGSSAVVPKRGAQRVFLALMMPLSVFVVAGWRARKPALLLLVAALGLVLLSCGGSTAGGGVTPPSNHSYMVQVRMQTARGTDVVTIDVAKVTVTIQH